MGAQAGFNNSKMTKERLKMKLTIPLIVALGFSSLAIAQEESPSPSTAESASATVQESPSEAITSSPAATAAAAQSPAAKKKESAAAASPAASAAQKTTTAAKPGKKMSVEAALKDNENRWEASYAAHDVSVAQSLVANDFVGVYWDGKVMSKSGIISEIKKDKSTYKSAVNDKLAVHSFGPSVAVVVGTAREKGTEKDGKAFDHVYRFTDTWVDRGGQWQCAASQVMRVK
jgi:ketosteroid isomerase-like protein